MRIGTLYGFSPVMRSYMSNRLPYCSPITLLAQALDGVGEVEVDAAGRRGPTPRPSSQTSLAAREAMSRGARLPKLGYLRSR